jgi:hypothetical protein
LPVSGRVTAKDFAVWVIEAEGLDPEHELEFRRRIADCFVRHMGASSVDVSELQ